MGSETDMTTTTAPSAPSTGDDSPQPIAPAAGEQMARVVTLATDLAKGTKWPGGVVGAFGAALILLTLVGEETSNRLATAEFVAVIIVGALLTLAGPLIVAYTDFDARRTAADVEKSDVEKIKAKAEVLRLRRELESQKDGQRQ